MTDNPPADVRDTERLVPLRLSPGNQCLVEALGQHGWSIVAAKRNRAWAVAEIANHLNSGGTSEGLTNQDFITALDELFLEQLLAQVRIGDLKKLIAARGIQRK